MTIQREKIVGTGTVQFLNRDSGNGKIRPDDGSEDLYISLEPQAADSIAKTRRVQYSLRVPEIGAPWLESVRAI